MLKAIHRTMLPKRYKEIPMLGRGVSSMVFDLGDHVDILTMDSIKAEFISSSKYSIDRYTHIEDLGRHPQKQEFDDMSVYSIKMKKLQKNTYSQESRRETRHLFSEFKRTLNEVEQELRSDYIHCSPRFDLNNFHQSVMQRIMDKAETDERMAPLAEIADHVSSFWAGDTYIFDLSPRNMLWDEEKKRVFVNDAIFPMDLWQIVNEDSYKYLMKNQRQAFNEKKERFNQKIRQSNSSLQPSI